MYKFMYGDEIVVNRSLLSVDNKSVLSIGNIMQIIGKQKSGKTGLAINIMAKLLGATMDLGVEATVCPNDKCVVYINTELSKSDFQRKIYTIYKLVDAKENIDNFICLHLKGYGPKELRNKVLKEIEDISINVLVIDGITDFINDFNSTNETQHIADMLMKLTEGKCDGIINVIHQNPESSFNSKSRGHLGTMLQNKSESTLIMNKKETKLKKEYFTLSCEGVRNSDKFNNKQFEYNNLYNNLTPIAFEEKEEEGYDDLFNEIFTDNKELASEELYNAIIEKLSVGRSTAIEIVKKCILITKVGDSRKAKWKLNKEV